MVHLICMGTIIRPPIGQRCSPQYLERQCGKATSVHSALVSAVGRRVPFESQLYVAFDDSGPSMQVPAESVNFVLEMLARMHSSDFGYVYDVSASGFNSAEDDDVIMQDKTTHP
jgi:hypothetical protein